MKKLVLSIFVLLFWVGMKAQSCEEMMDFVKSKSYGSTFYSPNSEAVSRVTFYDIYLDYKSYYFAIVCFKRKYAYQCSEYIYQVASNTKMYYSMNYMDSAGKAFWKYIQPYNENLGCAPDF
ncbi:hypothetical protein [Flagellimonas sp.]|uniref:hypothetical protein n=1 Tax=Flagellimonas sp. TaxID=2058762 RepID=UPI003AB48B88